MEEVEVLSEEERELLLQQEARLLLELGVTWNRLGKSKTSIQALRLAQARADMAAASLALGSPEEPDFYEGTFHGDPHVFRFNFPEGTLRISRDYGALSSKYDWELSNCEERTVPQVGAVLLTWNVNYTGEDESLEKILSEIQDARQRLERFTELLNEGTEPAPKPSYAEEDEDNWG